MKSWIAVVGTCLALAASVAQANPVVFQQAWDGTTANTQASQNDTNPQQGFGDFAKAYDNFSLATNTLVTDVHWTGGYFSPSQQSPISSFLIQIWSDAGGPAAVLFSETVAGAPNETSLGTVGSVSVFSYDVDLSNGFVALAGTTYWLSIQANLAYPPQWGWATSTGGDGVAFQDFSGRPRTRVNTDLAFSLTGTAATVPEPGTVALVALALLGTAVTSRRKLR